jgi:hypothetical protein
MFLGRLDDARVLYLQYRGEKNVQGALLPHRLASSHALPVPIGKTIATAMKRTAGALGTTRRPLAARMRLWRLCRRFAEAYLNGPLLRQLSVCFRLLQKLLLERAIFRFIGHPLKFNGMLKIFREHFNIQGTSR